MSAQSGSARSLPSPAWIDLCGGFGNHRGRPGEEWCCTKSDEHIGADHSRDRAARYGVRASRCASGASGNRSHVCLESRGTRPASTSHHWVGKCGIPMRVAGLRTRVRTPLAATCSLLREGARTSRVLRHHPGVVAELAGASTFYGSSPNGCSTPIPEGGGEPQPLESRMWQDA